MAFIPILSLVLLIISLAALIWSLRQQKKSGLPSGRVIYSDTSHWNKIEASLFDSELQLTGKPDYLVDNKDGILPVEVKSSHVTDAPYDSHIFQLAAYCRLVEKTYGKRPPYGIIHYPTRTFAIDYTPELEQALIDLLEIIRQRTQQAGKRRGEVERSHQSSERCLGCGYQEICEQALH